jgi:hypothetical protein
MRRAPLTKTNQHVATMTHICLQTVSPPRQAHPSYSRNCLALKFAFELARRPPKRNPQRPDPFAQHRRDETNNGQKPSPTAGGDKEPKSLLPTQVMFGATDRGIDLSALLREVVSYGAHGNTAPSFASWRLEGSVPQAGTALAKIYDDHSGACVRLDSHSAKVGITTTTVRI